MLPEDRHHTVRLESLTDEIPEEPAEFGLAGHPTAAAQPPGERLFEKRLVVYGTEDLVDGVPRGGWRDARLFNLTPDAQLAAVVHGRFRMRNRLGHPRIVDRPFRPQTLDSRVHGIRLVPFAREALPD
ncbi:MAG: hypothetical protein Q7J25_02590, partial [Vicinamibacterales bacterium]|nr:hypothetical protein [Vicinamibacterales bacterium]